MLLLAALASLPVQAMRQDEIARSPVPAAPVNGATALEPLNLRLPRPAARLPTLPATDAVISVQPRRTATVQLEPRKSFIEWGVEGSREALIACQRGAYPGATVAAYGMQGLGAEAQPDHCHRF